MPETPKTSLDHTPPAPPLPTQRKGDAQGAGRSTRHIEAASSTSAANDHPNGIVGFEPNNLFSEPGGAGHGGENPQAVAPFSNTRAEIQNHATNTLNAPATEEYLSNSRPTEFQTAPGARQDDVGTAPFKKSSNKASVKAGAGGAAGDVAGLSLSGTVWLTELSETSADDISLRSDHVVADKPYKPMDWVDKYFIWMHEHTFWAALAWLTGVGTYMNARAHWRHGLGYNAEFAREDTPDGPAEDGTYFQDKQHNRSLSLYHAHRAVHGGPTGHTVNEFKNWRSFVSPDSVDPHSYRVKDRVRIREGRPIAMQQWPKEGIHRPQLPDTKYEEELREASQKQNQAGIDFALVGIDTTSRFTGRTRRDWVAFRKNAETGEWTLLDARRYIIDAKNNCQPKISPANYIERTMQEEAWTGRSTGFVVMFPDKPRDPDD